MNSLLLIFRSLLDLVGNERLFPTTCLLFWCVVEIFSQEFFSEIRYFVYVSEKLDVLICNII
jgi:hypothetical protein